MILHYARTFLETYRSGSLTKAAEALGITQPAASSHIKGLEAVLGKPLFYREGRGIKPTPVAEALARSLSAPLDEVEQVLAAAKARSSAIAGTIHISGPGEFMQFLAARSMTGLSALGIKLRLQTGGRDFIVTQLREVQTDLAILAHDFKDPTIDKNILYTEKLIPVATAEWAARNLTKPYASQDLIGKSLIAYNETLALVRAYFETLHEIKCTDLAMITVPDLRIVKEFVLAGEGYSILPDYLCQHELKTGKLIALDSLAKVPRNPIYLIWPKVMLRDPRVVFVKNHLLQHFAVL